jgi:hypothetical protein
MLISVASEFSKKFRSIGANINDIASKVATISKTVSTNNNGVLDNSIGSDALSSDSVNNNNIASQSITADKLDISSISSPSSNQRIPAPLNSIEYWSPVLAENSALHTEPYFKDVKIKNVSVDANGLTFSPERATALAITNAEIEHGVVTLTTNVAHGYELNDTIQVSNLPSPFAGEWVISEAPPMANATTTATGSLGAFTITVVSASGILPGMKATATGIPTNSIVTSVVSTTVTIDQAITAALSTTAITFSGSKTICYAISRFNQIPINYKIGEEIAGVVSIGNDKKLVTSKSCSNGIITLSVQNRLDFNNQTNQKDNSFDGHGYNINDVVEVFGLGSPYDGTHLITDVPDNAPAVLKYSILNKTIDSFSTSIELESALGDGLNVLYTYSDNASINTNSSLDFYTNEPVTITGFSDTNYNITGVIESVGSSSFTVPNSYDTIHTPATAGSPKVIVAHVKVDAEARLFLTGKTKVPDSRSISVSWVTDGNPIDMYFACWIVNRTGSETAPLLIPVDDTKDLSISKLQGVNNYYWEIPVDVEYYSLLAEVLPGKNPVLLKEAYVFEAIGDQDQKTEHISAVSITNNIATVYTATTHPYFTGDVVQMFGLESANSALVGTPYEVDTVSDDATAFNVVTVGLSNTTGNVAVSGTVIGGYQKTSISSVSPSGLSIDASNGQSVNLTDDPTDNYLTITDSTAVAVASISNTGAGTFKTLGANSLSVDGDITIGNENTALVGTTNATYSSLIDAKFSGNSYGGALLDRLARGTVYQAAWLTPTSNIPSGITHYGLAAGTFKLDSNRLYQVAVSSSGMRANPNKACAFEIMMSTTPMRLGDDTGLAHMAYVLPTSTDSGIINNYWRDLLGHFYSISPTPVADNTTKFTISSWSRQSGNANIVMTLSNASARKYLQSNAADTTKMYVGINVDSTTHGANITGTYELTKINKTQYRVVTSATTEILSQTNAGMTLTLVDPIMTNTKATFSRAYQTGITGTAAAGSTTINATTTTNISVGDTIYRTAGASLANTTVTSITNSTAFVVANSAGSSGSITFSTNLTVATSDNTNHTYIMENLFQKGQLVDVDSNNAAWDITGGTIVSANATQFTITPTGTPQANGNTNTAVTTATWSNSQVQLHKNYLPSETDLYYIIRLRHGATTTGEYPITVSENPNGMMAVTDLGQAKQMTFVAQQGDNASPWTSGLPIGYTNTAANASLSSTNTATVTETQTVYASDSAYYDNYGKGTGTSIPYAYKYYLYQGNPGTASGVKKSAVLFPAFDFYNKTTGLTITKLEVYLRNRHSYNSNGLTVYLAAHADTTLGNSVPVALPACTANTTTFTKGQGKWTTLPSSWYSTFTNGGGGRGILLGVTDEDTTPDTYYDGITNYGYFDGINLDDAPQLRITYKYNATVGSNNSSGGGGGGGGYGAQVAL